jgi:hypothetical protein
MILQEHDVKALEQVFRSVYEYKSKAKEASASANDVLKTKAVEMASTFGTDEKTMKKVLSKAYKEWVMQNEGDDSIDMAIEIVEAMKGGE